MGYSTIAIIYNPNSTGKSKSLARKLAGQIRRRVPRQRVELIKTEHAGHGEALAYEIATSSKNPLVISSSGDGGYHDVVNGAMKAQSEGYRITTGLLPAGNANDHYHNLHRGEDIIDQITGGTPLKIDLLKLSGTSQGKRIERYAHSYIGFGLTPIVGNQLNQTQLNPLKETWIVAKALFTIKPARLQISKRPRYYESIILSNIDIMSKYIRISQPSDVTDGKFEVTIFKRRGRLKLILLLIKASFIGVTEDKQVSEFAVKTVRKTLVQADGEIMTLDARTDAHITIEQQVLACFI